MEHFEPIFEILDGAEARYVIVGGLAVNLHGHQRFTKDVDLALDLSRERLLPALTALRDAGYVPRIPVRIEELADSVTRERWIREKNMKVFQLYHDARRVTVDIMVDLPIEFEELWEDAVDVELSRTTVKVASIDHLVRMKRLAARPQDTVDVEALELIRRMLSEEEAGES